MLKLDKTIDKYTPRISLGAREQLASLCSVETYENESFLTKPHESNQWEYILSKGIARTFLLNTEGEEITLSFFEEHMVLPPYVTRTANGKSILYCQAVTDCEVIRIDAEAFEALMITNIEIRDFGNTVLRLELLHKVNKEIRMASWTAKERLQQFRRDFSMLENLIPHPMIASYLGITNVSLSRLRK